MSTTIDQRVVEMQFDNKHFESNVQTTLSTIEKLKQKLNFTGASKGLENINAASKSVNMSGLSSAVETVHAKFSALEVMGVTALANITNSAVNAGKRIASALTIDPIKTGFQEYETQINSVQTIWSNTKSKGSTLDDVNKALEELNLYADKTIYNFTEMTRNIGTFTAAGVELDTSVNAIQGIANLAAISGSTSQQASTAMYQLSQALAAGKVQLMDWNSVVNAGMGGEMFQNALKKTSELLGTGAEAAIKAKGSFRESLREGWLTAEVLTETLKKFTTTGANEYIAEYTGLTMEAVEAETKRIATAEDSGKAIEQAAEALAKASGKSEEEIASILEFAKDAEDAATKVKTFTQLWDVMKESAQSGWSQTWKLIVGDFKEARDLLTPLADTLTGFINKMSNARNFIVEGVMDFASPWTALTEKLGKVQEVAKTVTNVTDKLEYFQKVVNDVWRGDYKNSDTGRYDLLEKAGYDHRVVQDLVNKGYQYKITVEDIEASHKKFGLTMETTTEETEAVTSALANLDEETLRNAGLTEDEIRLYKDLAKGAEKYGMSIEDLAKKMSETSGRDLLIEGFKNIGSAIVNVFKAIGNAWGEIFDPVSIVNLYMAIEKFRDWTESLQLVDKETGKLNETGQKIQRTFKGIFAIVDVLTTILGGGLKIAFKVIGSVLKYFGIGILDVTAYVGDAAVKFRDWVDSLFDISGLVDGTGKAIEKIVNWFKALADLPGVEHLADAISRLSKGLSDMNISPLKAIASGIAFVFDRISGKIKELTGFDISGFFSSIFSGVISAVEKLTGIDLTGAGKNIFDGLMNGLKDGAKGVIDTITEAAANLIDKFCEILGIHSPSRVFIAIGGFIIAGLISGISQGLISVPESLQGIVDKCIAIFKGIDWGTIMALGVSVGGLLILKKIGDILDNLTAPFAGIGDLIESLSKVTNALAFNINTKSIKNLAITLAILAGTIIALVHLGGDDPKKLLIAVGVVTWLAIVLAGLSIALNKLSESSIDIEKGKFSLSGLKTGLLTMAAAIAVIAGVVYLLGDMDSDAAKNGFKRLGIVVAGMVVFIAALGGLNKILKNDTFENVDKIGGMMIKLGIAMALMVGVCKLIDMLSPGEMIKAGIFALGFGAFVVAITKVAKSAGNNVGKVGGMMVKLAIAMALMVGVCKLIDMLSPAEMIKGGLFAAAMLLFVRTLVKVTTIGGKQQIAKLGGLLLSISISMMLMVGICKLVGMLTVEDMIKGAAFAAGFAVFVWALVSITKIGSEQRIAKVAGTIIGISIAVGALAAVCMLLSLLSIESLVKGVTAVTILGLVMAVMIKSLQGINATKDLKGSLLMMVVAIGLMAVAVASLSMIPVKNLYSAVGALSIIMGMFALIVRSTKDIQNVIWPLVVMTAAIGVMAGALILLSKTTKDADSNIKNAVALSALMLAMSGVIRIINKMGDGKLWNTVKNVFALAALAVPMAAFALALKQMNGVQNAITNVAAISLLMYAMTGVLAIINATHFGLMDLGRALLGIIALTALVGPMAAFIAMLAWMENIDNATINAKAITKLMFAMTGLLAILTVIGGIVIGTGGIAGGAIVIGIVALTAMAIPMAVFIGMISKMDGIKNAEKNANLLIGLMSIMTGLLTHLAIIGPFALIGVAALAGLTLLVAAIGGLVVGLGALNELTDGGLEKLIDSGIPLLIKLADGIGLMIGKFIGSIGEGLGDSLVKIGEDIAEFMSELAKASENAQGIDGTAFDGVGQLIKALAGVGLTSVGLSIADFWIKILGGDKTAMEKFTDDSIAFFEAIKEISTAMEGVTMPETINFEGIISLVDAIKKIALSMVGVRFADIFVEEDNAMYAFENNGVAFFEAIKEISTAMEGVTMPEKLDTKGVVSLVDTIKQIAAAMVGVRFADIFVEEDNAMYAFENNGVAFFEAIKEISTAMEGVTMPEELDTEGVVSIIDTIKKVAAAMFGVRFSDIFVEEDNAMYAFENNGVAFFEAIKEISKAMEGVTMPETINSEGIISIIDTIKKVGSAMMGESWKDAFTWGEDSPIEKFKTDGLMLFGTVKKIADKAASITLESFTNAQNAIDKIKSIIASVAGLDYSGVEQFTGIGTGGIGADGPMHDIGVALKDFGEQVAGINVEAVNTSVTAAKQIRSIISNLVSLDTSGIANFKAKDIGTAIKDYNTQVEGIDTAVISSSITSAKRLISLIGDLVGLDNSGVALFNVKSIGEKMKAYSDSVVGIDVGIISSSISVANRLKSFITSLVGFDGSGVSAFKTAVEELGSIQVGNIAQVFTDAIPVMSSAGANLINAIAQGMRSKQGSLTSTVSAIIAQLVSSMNQAVNVFSMSGTTLMDRFTMGMRSRQPAVMATVNAMINIIVQSAKKLVPLLGTTGAEAMSKFAQGLRSQNVAVSTAMTSSIASAVTTARGYYSSFYSAGSYLVDGFADGISENDYKAAAKAAAMAEAAKQAAEEALGIASPSKVFYKIGDFVGQGFTKALGDYNDKSYDAGSSMADQARKGMTYAIKKIQNVLNSDMDVQPTIRPVLDLSDVRSGAAAIGGLFADGATVGVMSNVNTISSMVNDRIQNGANNDVVSAINKLRSDLSNVGGTTYSINGITYDDGSNITDAIKTIARHAKMERRI